MQATTQQPALLAQPPTPPSGGSRMTNPIDDEFYLNVKGVMARLGIKQSKAYDFINKNNLWVKIEGIGRRVRLSQLLEVVEESASDTD